MIVVDANNELVSVNVMGEFALADIKEFEEVVNFKVQFDGPVNLLFDLRQMTGATVDVALEELRFSKAHGSDFGRIAVLSDSPLVAWSAWLSQVFVQAELQVFKDEEDARAWLVGVAESETGEAAES